MVDNLGASIFPSTAATDVTSAVTTTIADNIAPVLVLLGFYIALRVAVKMFSGAANKGKLRI